MKDTSGMMRVRKVLLAGSPYDAFLLEQAGFQRDVKPCSDAPSFDLVRSGKEVLDYCEKTPPDLVIADYSLSDMTAFDLGKALSKKGGSIPVMVVTSRSDLGGISAAVPGREFVHGLFIWYGDPEVLRTLVRLYEDECSAKTLLESKRALAIMLVEDEPNFYSHYLPTLYTQIRRSALELIPESMRPTCPWSRIGLRPLVLLRQDYESACAVLDAYPGQIIAIVTDLQFPLGGTLNVDAGLRLMERAHAYEPHMPIIVQSRQVDARATVESLNGYFLWKDSPRLIGDLKEFLWTYCGFGPFVFRWPDGTEWARANTLDALRALLAGAPQSVFEYHGSHNDFSAWLGVHGYGELAAKVRMVRNLGREGRLRVIEMLDIALREEHHGGL